MKTYKNRSPFSLQQRINSFRHAICGLYVLFKNEANAKIHLVAGIIAFTMAFVLKVSSIEWLFIIVTSAAVLFAEAINTSIEYLADEVCAEANIQIGKIKDIAAAAVLITAIAALATGSVIFIPKILNLLPL